MFLPASPIVLSVVLLFAAACADPAPAGGMQAPAPAAEEVRVVAGTGDVPQDAVDRVRSMVLEELPALGRTFRGTPKRPFFVHVHASRSSMPESLAVHMHAEASGFTLLGAHQIHLAWAEMRRTSPSLRGVVVHELVHELLDQYVHPNGARIPRWFHEGLAQHIAGDTYLGAREDDLVWRVGARRLLAFGDLRAGFPADEDELRTAYAQSFSYVSWLAREFGLDSLLAVAAATDDLTSFERALVGRTGRSTLELEDAWKEHLLHASGAPWRVLFDQCFSLLLVGALPLLALAMIRRLAADKRAASRLARTSGEETPPPAVDAVDGADAAAAPDAGPEDEGGAALDDHPDDEPDDAVRR